MKKPKITIVDILKIKNYKLLNKKEYDAHRPIEGKMIARKGLQLSGFLDNFELYSRYLVGWGTNEYSYFKKLDKKIIRKKLEQVINEKTPGIILSKGFKDDEVLDILMEVAEKNKIPVCKLEKHMASVSVSFNNLINNHSEHIETIHASFVVINDVGVLIKGHSGIGKSESVLEIIQKNHIFIGDDSIEIYKNGENIYGKPSKISKDLLEVRGIGLINIPFIYGKRSVASAARIDLIVELVKENIHVNFDRLGINNLTEKLLDIVISKTLIPIKVGRTISSLIIAAASVYAAKKEGMDPLQTIKSRRG